MDKVNHPSHYTNSESGVECIEIVEHISYSLGNAIKYLWRAGLKDDLLTDLKKARWYLDREYSNNVDSFPVVTPEQIPVSEWMQKFERHIDTVDNPNIKSSLSFCMYYVAGKRKRDDLNWALDHLEDAIRPLEIAKRRS